MKTTILCSGDSVTQGNSAESSYPGRLQAILTEQGYDVEVTNCGHGGECLSAIVARMGGIACYLGEDLVFPADNSPVSLGQRSFIGGRIGNTKLRLCYPDVDGEDLCVYFTDTNRDTNPVTIGGKEYILTIDQERSVRSTISKRKTLTASRPSFQKAAWSLPLTSVART